jgi:hypothetical protein
MAETRIQGAVSVIGEIQFKHADTLVETSGTVGYCCLENEFGFHRLGKSIVQGLLAFEVSCVPV